MVVNEGDGADTGEGANDFWNADFGGGNSNIDQQPDQTEALAGADGAQQDFPTDIVAADAGQNQPVNRPKVGHAFEAPLSEEEELRIQQIEEEQSNRLRTLQLKEEEEYKLKKDKQTEARAELDNWYAQKNTEREAKSKQNKEEEWAYLQTRDEHKKSKNPWEKIVDNVEINPNKYLGKKDVTRMRQAMLARKGDLKEGRL